uniref:Nucleotide-diphospho-sugar transferase domain-containing protein n=1 Tax=Meloidogyne floridensis TaxID=298350 RepID=A0A915P6K9_9BILA
MNVLNYVKNNSEEVNIERLLSLTNVKATLSSLPNNQSTLIMFLNRHIIQMTINCPAEGNNLIAGGYFFVRPTLRSTQFFAKLATNLLNKYTPDNGLMTSLCSDSSSINCGQIPFCSITNWLWLQNYVSTTDKNGEIDGDIPLKFPSYLPECNPSLIQFDGDADSGGKLGKMRLEGYYFLLDDGKTCNFEGIKEMEGGIRHNTVSKETRSFYSSFSQQQFTFYLVSC